MRYKIFGNFPPEVSFLFNFASAVSRIFSGMVRIPEIQQFFCIFGNFSRTFWGTISRLSKVWRNGKRPQFSKSNQVTSHLFLIRVVR